MIREILVIPDNFMRLVTSEAKEGALLTRLHVHREIELLHILRGSLNIYTEGFSGALNPGDVIVFNENIPHSTYASTDAAYETLQFDFNGVLDKSDAAEFLSATDNIPYLRNYTVIKKDSILHNEISTLINNIKEHYEIKGEYPEFIKADFYYLYDFLVTADMFSPTSQSSSSSGFRKVRKTIDYINSNYSENITLEMLSREFDLDPSYLCRSFKKFTGYTIIEYVNYVRVKNAEKKMIYQDCSLAEIGKAVGFPSQSYFIKTFKKYLLYTPLQYKKLKTGKTYEWFSDFTYLHNEKGGIV